MTRRRTTIRDLARLRELAAAGLSMTAAAHELGMSRDAVRYYQTRRGLGFRRGALPPRPVEGALLAQATARLAATMQRLRAP